MRQYNVYKASMYSPYLGIVNIEIDEAQSTEYGNWRQLKPFNKRLPAAGTWKFIFGNHQPKLYLYESGSGHLSKSLAIFDGFFKNIGRRGNGKLQVKSVSDSQMLWQLAGVRKVQEVTVRDMAAKTIHSTWKFTGSRGISYSVGEGLEVVGGTGEFSIEGSSEGKSSKHTLIYSTAGLGTGFSELPYSISGSSSEMPSGGIGTIVSQKKETSLLDFEGFCTIIEVSANSGAPVECGAQGAGGGLFAVIFSLAANPYTTPFMHLLGGASYGFMWGSQIGITGASVGGSYSTGTVVVMT